jgi:hypothetical protein
MKKCSTCKEIKDDNCFYFESKKPGKLRFKCKDCKKNYEKEHYTKNKDKIKENNKEYYQNNKDKIKENKKEYRQNNKDKIKENNKEYYQNNKDKIKENNKEYYQNNKDKIKENKKEYYQNNKEKILETKNEYELQRIKTDPVFKTRKNIGRSIGRALKDNGGSKNGHSCMQRLPWTIEEFWLHMESYFRLPGNEWMNRSNQGVFKLSEYIEDDPSTWTWHLDHIKPHSKFKYTTMDCNEFRKCWALSNLQPLKSIDNMKFGNKKKPK